MGTDLKAGWIKNLKQENKVSFVAIQETQIDEVSPECVSKFWGGPNFCMEYVGALGRSGGLLCMWDPLELNVVNIYAPHRVLDKRALWNCLLDVISSGNGQWVLLGDFNAVRFSEERKNSVFNIACARDFNDFIDSSGLVEYSMRGCKFTFLAPNSNKHSKLDRVLVCKGFFEVWPDACLRALPRLHSDHFPLILVVTRNNFGEKPFRFFNSWLEKEGFDDIVENAVNSYVRVGDRRCGFNQ
ncbi:uncharacterized protein LOC110887623 [Helianthus annuus]|uniref:uncharacterized protein LOC110887623 n=1 Tax=Helianthus annuus TaxID=4232 RepID=UPI001652F204|nr:uncharacterized protein LOC110887623 [Helianthus annuus]